MLDEVVRAVDRAGRWQLRECGSLARDLWRSRHHPLWWRILGLLSFGADEAWAAYIVSSAAIVVIVLLLAYLAGGWLALLAWAVAGYVAIAGITAVPRARHHIRRAIRFAAVSITHGIIDKRPAADQRHRWQPRPRRVRFNLGTRQLRSCDLPLAQVWRQASDESRARLIDELKSRLRPFGLTVTVEWDQDAPTPHVRLVAALPDSIEGKLWDPPKGLILLGATSGDHPRAVTIDDTAFAMWSTRHNPHMLFAGDTGNGKTSGLRWITHAIYDASRVLERQLWIAGIDGKQGGNLAYLKGREGVLGIADEPDEWVDVAREVHRVMEERYAKLRRWRHDPRSADNPQGIPDPRPTWGSQIYLIVDEFVDIRDEGDSGDEVMRLVGKIARLGREAGLTLVLSCLRPDSKDAIPGLIKRQLSARLLLGNVTDHVMGTMMFDGMWRDAYALSNPADDEIPGRGIARLGGRLYRIQIPHVPDLAEDPASGDLWLPPREAVGSADGSGTGSRPEITRHSTVEGEVVDSHDEPPKRQRTRTRGGQPVTGSRQRTRRATAASTAVLPRDDDEVRDSAHTPSEET